MKSLEERAEHEIDLILQDDSLSIEEKKEFVKDVYMELREAMREQDWNYNEREY